MKSGVEVVVLPTPKLLRQIENDATRSAVFDEASEIHCVTRISPKETAFLGSVDQKNSKKVLSDFSKTVDRETDCLVEAVDENGKILFWRIRLAHESTIDYV